MKPSAAHVKAVRAFNRFYTQRIGVLKRYLGSDFTLTEVRVLYELAHRGACTATGLGRDLDLDAGYLSRILRRFEHKGWIEREAAAHDARQNVLRMTARGHDAFEPLQQKSRDETAALIASVAPGQRTRLIAAMNTVQTLLAEEEGKAKNRSIVLRDPEPGDMGWVVQAHGEIYWREYQFDARFEALVAEIAAKFIRRFDPQWEKGWIAEVDGERVGSVIMVRRSRTVAQLRLLILAPQARGLGLGGRLVDECIAFAREKRYRKITLWTQSNLLAARAVYRSRGFRCVKSEPYDADFHPDLTSEIWELSL
jgi:DNA-binding MarR family transcriptional regulator/N-acetylglutamate synthase-like GNAT family acetyltransferase